MINQNVRRGYLLHLNAMWWIDKTLPTNFVLCIYIF